MSKSAERVEIATIQGIEPELRAFFAARGVEEGLAAVYLFGSVARGTAGPASDVDVGLLYRVPPPLTLQGLGFDLESELTGLLRWPVQVVVLNNAPVDLSQRVLRDGILVYEGDPSRRVEFEVKTRNEYWDLLPYLKLYRKLRL